MGLSAGEVVAEVVTVSGHEDRDVVGGRDVPEDLHDPRPSRRVTGEQAGPMDPSASLRPYLGGVTTVMAVTIGIRCRSARYSQEPFDPLPG